MNKAELVEEVTNQTGLTKKTSREAIDAITSVISDAFFGGGGANSVHRSGQTLKSPSYVLLPKMVRQAPSLNREAVFEWKAVLKSLTEKTSHLV